MKDIITVSMLLIPMISHWLLPEGIERSLYINFLEFPIYSLDICYLFFITRYNNLKKVQKVCLPTSLKRTLYFTFLFFIVYASIIGALNNQDSLICKLLGDNWFYFSAFIFLCYPLPNNMLQKTSWFLVPTAIIISLEVILFATGTLTYKEELGNQEFGGINRISTTIGAATGTAVILYMLGGLILSVYNNLDNRIKWATILLITIAIFFTISRGSILAWTLFLSIFVYKNYIYKKRLSTKIYTLILIVATIFCLNAYNIFDPVRERQEILETQDMVDTNRESKIQETLICLQESNYLGVGLGEIKVDKALDGKVAQTHNIGVHSFYYNILGETGIIGLCITLILIFNIIIKFDYKNNVTYLSLIVIILTFSTEPVFVLAEFTTITFFIFSIALKKFSLVRINTIYRKKNKNQEEQ